MKIPDSLGKHEDLANLAHEYCDLAVVLGSHSSFKHEDCRIGFSCTDSFAKLCTQGGIDLVFVTALSFCNPDAVK